MEEIMHQMVTIGNYETLYILDYNGINHQLMRDFATIHSNFSATQLMFLLWNA